MHNSDPISVLIIGAGAAGICMGVRLGQAGIPYVLLEKADGVGGTWRENTYPGCACDTQSHHYSYSFELNPGWSRVYAEQEEILAYLQHCAQKFDVLRNIQFGQEVSRAVYDAATGIWTVETSSGQSYSARILVSAVGQLNRPSVPDIPGLQSFDGAMFHTAQWDHGVELTGKQVAVIGNGASALQLIPRIAEIASRVLVFQRSPNWLMPKHDRVISRWEKRLFRRIPAVARLYRYWIYWNWERNWPAFLKDSLAGRYAKRKLSRQVSAALTGDALTQALTPDYPVGCKRILLSDDYYTAMQRDNVVLVTDPIDRIEAGGVSTGNGDRHPADCIVLATGFKSTEFLAPMEIRGADGTTLKDAWRDTPQAYLGVTVAGFPNFFMLYGPNTNLGHNSIIFMIECQVRYIMRAIKIMKARDLASMEVTREAISEFNDRLQTQLQKTAWVGGCSSWYKTADGKVVNNWSATTCRYWLQTRRPDLRHYTLHPRVSEDAADSIRTAP